MKLLTQKYRILGKIGEGTFSEVLHCQAIKDGTARACKKMKQTYESLEQVNSLREIQAMRRLSTHPNILQLFEVIFDNKSGTLILVCELMDMNIYELIRGKRHYLPEKKIQNFMFQLLKATDHMHRHGIFHRDIKPENILVKEDLLKLADFGSCRSMTSKQPYTEYISTRWYRAPECLLTDGYYNYKMDVWSIGCVFFELLSLHPLFPGANELDQINKIHDLLGTPQPNVLNKLRRSKGMTINFPFKKGSGIEKLLSHVSAEAVQLIYFMCTYDPDERITAHQALKHKYFRNLRNSEKNGNLKVQQQMLQSMKKEGEEMATQEQDTDDISEAIIKLDQDPSSPLKTRMTEITMYPVLPKASSHPTHPFKDRRRHRQHHHHHVLDSHFLPRVPMHATTFNPTFHTTSFPTSFNKLPAAGFINNSLMSNIDGANRQYKVPGKAGAFFNQYKMPSLDQQRF